MADLAKIKDDELRAQLEEAHQQLRSGKPTEAVHTLSDAFLALLEKHPEAARQTVPARGGRRAPLVGRWPNLGANLSMQSVREGKPSIEFTRERFALSEAITYYEFTVEAAIAMGG